MTLMPNYSRNEVVPTALKRAVLTARQDLIMQKMGRMGQSDAEAVRTSLEL
jgi:hypothetical protein